MRAGVLHTDMSKLEIVQHAKLPMILMLAGNKPTALQIVPFAGLEHAQSSHRQISNQFVIIFGYLSSILYIIGSLSV